MHCDLQTFHISRNKYLFWAFSRYGRTLTRFRWILARPVKIGRLKLQTPAGHLECCWLKAVHKIRHCSTVKTKSANSRERQTRIIDNSMAVRGVFRKEVIGRKTYISPKIIPRINWSTWKFFWKIKKNQEKWFPYFDRMKSIRFCSEMPVIKIRRFHRLPGRDFFISFTVWDLASTEKDKVIDETEVQLQEKW